MASLLSPALFNVFFLLLSQNSPSFVLTTVGFVFTLLMALFICHSKCIEPMQHQQSTLSALRSFNIGTRSFLRPGLSAYSPFEAPYQAMGGFA